MEEKEGNEHCKIKNEGVIRSGSQGKKEKEEREDNHRVKDEFPGGSVSSYWCVSLSLIVSLPWL